MLNIAEKDSTTPTQALTFRVQTFQENSASSIKGDNSPVPVMRWVSRAPNLSYLARPLNPVACATLKGCSFDISRHPDQISLRKAIFSQEIFKRGENTLLKRQHIYRS